MSSFHNYAESATHYDVTRQAVAYEIWLGAMMRYAPAALQNVRLLDAGIGTGNYTDALASFVGQVNGIDLSHEMLKQAKAKFADVSHGDKIKLEQGSLLALPFEAETFDAVMINQVLHHLDDGTDKAYNGHRAAVNEASRVLKPGGVLLVNACSHRQLRDGFWYNQLIAHALDDTCARIAPVPLFAQMIAEAGLEVQARHVPVHSIMQGDAYFEMKGVFSDEWRAGDSIWSVASKEELDAARNTVRRLIEADEADNWFETRDRERRHVGQLTFWIAQKTS
ncbi:MAG: methyltransferase domain-containing protein [Hyphomicrobiales bacterium]